jgi:hypothetical protein
MVIQLLLLDTCVAAFCLDSCIQNGDFEMSSSLTSSFQSTTVALISPWYITSTNKNFASYFVYDSYIPQSGNWSLGFNSLTIAQDIVELDTTKVYVFAFYVNYTSACGLNNVTGFYQIGAMPKVGFTYNPNTQNGWVHSTK